MIRGKRKRMAAAAMAAVLAFAIASPASAVDSVLLSALLPGLGQAQDGHYGRATTFAGAAMISAAGLFASQINYSRSTERYENEKRTYLYYQHQIDAGHVVKIEDVDATHAAMTSAWDDADKDARWRNVFLGALVATYAVNLVDILRSKPDSGEIQESSRTSLEWRGDGFQIVRTIRF